MFVVFEEAMEKGNPGTKAERDISVHNENQIYTRLCYCGTESRNLYQTGNSPHEYY